MAKRTKIERAAAAAALYDSSDTDLALHARIHYEAGWVDGYSAGTRDAQRRMARKFKRGLRLSWDKP